MGNNRRYTVFKSVVLSVLLNQTNLMSAFMYANICEIRLEHHYLLLNNQICYIVYRLYMYMYIVVYGQL